MGDVAADRHGQSLKRSLDPPDGQRIEQGLGRVFVAAVAGIEHGAIDFLGQKVDGAGMGMPHDQQVRVHGIERQGGVDQGLALFDRTGLHGHVHHIRPETLAGQLETGLRPSRILEEHVDLGEPRQFLAMFDRSPVQFDIFVGQIQNCGDLIRFKRFDPQKMSTRKSHLFLRSFAGLSMASCLCHRFAY